MDFNKRAKLSYHELVRAIAHHLKTLTASQSSSQAGNSTGKAPPVNPSIVVATSGGADSVALLRTLHLLSGKRGWEMNLIVGHVQHHLREDEAEADADFVQALANELKLTYARRDVDLTGAKNVENAARQLRYQALCDIANGYQCPFIATAHHADDQLETLLMRMLRGAGAKGMRGIAKSRQLTPEVKIIRPMLSVKREVVIDFLHQAEQGWREDHTNADVQRWRAKLRHEVLPVLKEIREDAAVKAVQLGEKMRGLDAVLRDQIQQVKKDCVQQDEHGVYLMDRRQVCCLRKPVLVGLLRQLVMAMGVDSDRGGERELGPIVKAVRDGEGGERTFQLNAGVQVVVTREVVRICGQR